MTVIRQARQLLIALMALFVLCAWSLQATAPISILVPDQYPPAVMKRIEQIGASLKYRQGRVASKEGETVTVLEDEKRYRLYFVNDEFRTSFKVEIPKAAPLVNVVFEEFGAKTFSQEGAEQYQLLVDSLVAAFGNDSVVSNKRTDTPGL